MIHLEATAIQVMLAARPVKILAAYLTPSRPLMGADLTACFGGELSVFLTGDLNAKNVDWNSRLTTRRRKLLRHYADENSCLILGSDTLNNHPIQPLRYSRCLGHRDSEGPPFSGVSDFVLCTKFGSPPGTH
jgi:hypothetical protein